MNPETRVDITRMSINKYAGVWNTHTKKGKNN